MKRVSVFPMSGAGTLMHASWPFVDPWLQRTHEQWFRFPVNSVGGPYGWAYALLKEAEEEGAPEGMQVTVYPMSRAQETRVQMPGLLTENATNRRMHAMARSARVKQVRASARSFFQAAGVHLFEPPLHVHMTLRRPRTIKDSDGLPSYGKAIRDELADLLGYDDQDLIEHPPMTFEVHQEQSSTPQIEVVVFRLVKPAGATYKKKPSAGAPKIPRALAKNMEQARAAARPARKATRKD